jgi:hypothetical protein
VALPVEEVRRQLEAAAVPDAQQGAQDRARRTSGQAGRVAASLTYADHQAGGRRRPMGEAEIGAWLDAASERQRRKVWRAIQPELADTFESWWSRSVRDPYPVGSTRRAFRAPRHPEFSRSSRVQTLRAVAWVTASYAQPIAWYAAWAAHLGSYGGGIGRLLAAALDEGDGEVRDVLHATLRGEHPVGQVGRDLVTALLASSDPDGWVAVERLLLAAQRQEGLRSVILESVDLAHPDAFRRILHVVHDEGLTRFAAVVRAVGVWFGILVDVGDRAEVDALLADALVLLDDPAARDAAIAGPDPSRVHLALWCLAFEDAPAAAERAVPLLTSDAPDHRLAAARLLDETQLSSSRRALVRSLRDPDLRLAALAARAIHADHTIGPQELGGPVRDLLGRVPARIDVDLGVLRPEPGTLDPALLADALVLRTAARDVLSLTDVIGRTSAHGRDAYARLLGEDPGTHRGRLLDLLADRSGNVRDTVLRVLGRATPPTPAEAPALEALLTRKAAALRRGVLGLLLRQDDTATLASVERLRTGDAQQRVAGAELLRELVAAGRAGDAASRLARAVAADPSASDGERRLVASVVGDAAAPPTPTIQLIDHTRRTPADAPSTGPFGLGGLRRGVDLVLTSLDAWLAEHRDLEVTIRGWDGSPEVRVLGDLRHIPTPDGEVPWRDQHQQVPLAEVVEPWLERTRPQLDADGVELAVALAGLETAERIRDPYGAMRWTGNLGPTDPPSWMRRMAQQLVPDDVTDALAYRPVAGSILRWCVVREAATGWIGPLLDLAEGAVAGVPAAARRTLPTAAQALGWSWQDPPLPTDWRDGVASVFLEVLHALDAVRPELFAPEERGRLWRLTRYVDEPRGAWAPDDGHDEVEDPQARYLPGGPVVVVPRRPVRRSATVGQCVRAIEDGVADRADLLDLFVGERVRVDGEQGSLLRTPYQSSPLSALTSRRPPRIVVDHPWVADVVDHVRSEIVGTEATRGELPTPVSAAARELRSVRGAADAVRLLVALGDATLVRGWTWGVALSRPEVLSHLLQVAFPGPEDSPESFARLAREAGLRDPRLLQLAVYAPQWAPAVEHTLGWSGLADGVHWLHAHTKDERWAVDADVREEWAAATSERTPLTAEELLRGDVDVAWFERVLAGLGDDRFDRLLKVGKLAAAGGGHKRAELFAQALRGRVDRAALDRRIADKRHQDAVRALGLLPLPDDAEAARAEVLARYEQLEDWRRGSRRSGQQRRTSEGLAADVAIANLARTAGYADPQRLRWAMEAEAVRDLAAGPVEVVEDDVTVTLSLTAEGAPLLQVRRGERKIKGVPKAVAKREAVVELKERVRRLRGQTSRMRASLEGAMVHEERFSVGELAELLAHPSLAPMLRSLVLVDATGQLGTADGDGSRWLGPDGTHLRPAPGPVAIAHPVDLLRSGAWHRWQRWAFEGRTRQPFKQVFRELYVPTAAEKDGAVRSDRYAGHQVNPAQAVGLFGGRGWVADREFGAIRTYHEAAITVRVEVLHGWLTAVEAADTTLESVIFTRVGSWEPLPIAEVDTRLFSEAMRDLDLVVSVAHSGGVDPEASQSTVEVRAALVRETAELLDLDNVELTDHHALIVGTLASYSVHLGSGTVHRRPGNAVCIVPVGAQHRGRLFLPFVDDDPRTAEVVSKIVLLARDERIQDPMILEQLRA